MSRSFEVVAGHAARNHDALALVTEDDGTRTFGELVERARTLAAVFDGVAPGRRIGLLLENSPAWAEAYLAASASGVASVALNPQWTAEETAFALRCADVGAVVCPPHLVSLVPADVPVVDPNSEASLAGLVRGAGSGADEHVVFTSGTTAGRPKAVRTRMRGAGGVDYRALIGITERDRALVVTPFFHVNGLGGLLSALHYGASVLFPRRFSASRFWDLVDRYRPTYLMTLAPIVHIVLANGPSPRERHHSLRVVIAAGAGSAAARMEERLGAPVVDWYGMTEATGCGTVTALGGPRRLGSAGRRFPESKMTILRSDGRVAAPREIGEVAFPVKSIPFIEYINDPEATAAVLDGTWFRSGDLGYFDEDDYYFFFVDRKKDIVRRGGENVSSIEVEEALRTVPGVADVAVVGTPDPVLGERVAAFVVPTGTALTLEDIRDALRPRLAAYKIPESLHLVDDLPRTPTGKVVKALLRSEKGRS